MGKADDTYDRHKSGLRALPAAAAALFIGAWLLSACAPEEKRYVPNSLGGDITPTMATTDVTTLISDSGYTRYKITTPQWLMYEDAEEPFWRFPAGLELEQYDFNMQPESNVECDSAVYYSKKRLWRLDGNVVMVNTLRDSFLTQQLFWDQDRQKIYSDSFIHIVRSDRTIEGYGFESDQSMTEYLVHRPTAILPAERRPGAGRKAESDSTSAPDDSLSRPAPAAKPARRPRPEATPASTTAPANAAAITATPAKKDDKNIKQPLKLTPAK